MIKASLLDFERLHRLRGGAVIAQTATTHFRITGPGALSCLQGLWTNDIIEPGEGSITYGALLTPKGMLVADGWALRTEDAVDLLLPVTARDAVSQIFRRSLPPRLAAAADLSDTTRVLQLLGDGAAERWPVVPLGRLPEGGAVTRGETAGGEFHVAIPQLAACQGFLIGSAESVTGVATLLESAGMAPGNEEDCDAARILAGWPALGAEIDDRTLPQEVRFDEHGGISYTKGCYTGQETVARLHFRGHANRVLRGLRWTGAPGEDDQVLAGDKKIGRVSSVLTLPDHTLGLAILRRELQPGNRVTAGGSAAVVLGLPFGPADIEG
jgi:folate-binding protein YgfZ